MGAGHRPHGPKCLAPHPWSNVADTLKATSPWSTNTQGLGSTNTPVQEGAQTPLLCCLSAVGWFPLAGFSACSPAPLACLPSPVVLRVGLVVGVLGPGRSFWFAWGACLLAWGLGCSCCSARGFVCCLRAGFVRPHPWPVPRNWWAVPLLVRRFQLTVWVRGVEYV